MFGGLVHKSHSAAGNGAETQLGKDTHNAQGEQANQRLAFLMLGDEVKVTPAGRSGVPADPTAQMQAANFLNWLSATPCAGKWVSADHIIGLLYPEFCLAQALKSRPIQSVLKHLKRLTKKRTRDVEVGLDREVRRQVQYLVPKSRDPKSALRSQNPVPSMNNGNRGPQPELPA